jgi:hypothetical protein
MLEDLEYLGTFSSGVVKPGFMTADVTQEWSSLAFVEHHDPLHSVCLHQTERVPLEQGDTLHGLLVFSPPYQGGDQGEVGFFLLVRNISER